MCSPAANRVGKYAQLVKCNESVMEQTNVNASPDSSSAAQK